MVWFAGFFRGINIIAGRRDLGLARRHDDLVTAAEVVISWPGESGSQRAEQIEPTAGLALAAQCGQRIRCGKDPVDQLQIGIIRELRLHQRKSAADVRCGH